MDLPAALDWLADHINLEARPSPRAADLRLDDITRVLDLMGDPHRAYPVIHITGTNGKGSTARMATAVLAASGLSVGTYTSPHLERVNERMAWAGPRGAGTVVAEPIADDALADALSAVAAIEDLLDVRLTHFEILTSAAFRWFADVAVDLAVVEVGMGGRHDATNVVDGQVAVVTNVSLDHADAIGPDLAAIAATKAGIVKPGSTLVLGETEPALAALFRARPAETVWARGTDFGWTSNRLAVGGRALDLYTPGARYDGLFLPAHGPFQGDNAAAALAAAEAFFGKPVDPDVVGAGFSQVKLPGRLEVVGHGPLCILDGAHNPAGARAAAAALAMGVAAHVCDSVPEAVDLALAEANADEMVLVTGSLYVVGAARAWLSPAGAGTQ